VSAACASLEECQGNTRLDCLRQRCEKWRRASGNADTERHGSDKAVLSPDTRNYIASLVAERDALAEDAERYRWLRDYGFCIYLEVFDSDADSLGSVPANAERLDAAIDAARLSAKEPT
jgi:hypothetical protein